MISGPDPLHMQEHKKLWIVLAIIILFAGLDIAIFVSKLNRLLGVGLALIGLTLLILVGRSDRRLPGALGKSLDTLRKEEENRKLPIIAERFVHYYTFKGRFPWLMPLTGIVLLLGVTLFNIYLSKFKYLGSNDYVLILLASSIISYNYIPKKYAVERDFLLIFVTLLFFIVVIPTSYYSMKYGTSGGSWEDENPNSPLIHYLLVKPLIYILKIFGIDAVADGVTIIYHRNHERLQLSIALGCTGLYSVSIFFSAFTAYILVEYRKFDRKVMALLILGVITSYVANLMRMTIILLVGYYYGMDALLWTHENIGEIIFMIWIGIFWGLMFKYLDIEVPWEDGPLETTQGTLEQIGGPGNGIAEDQIDDYFPIGVSSKSLLNAPEPDEIIDDSKIYDETNGMHNTPGLSENRIEGRHTDVIDFKDKPSEMSNNWTKENLEKDGKVLDKGTDEVSEGPSSEKDEDMFAEGTDEVSESPSSEKDEDMFAKGTDEVDGDP